jgi:broad specificity phosphatase PhoE
VSALYLIRHGQAGTRLRYDTLSAKGRVQARLLGRYLAEQKIAIRAALSGTLERQRETAAEAAEGYREAGGEFPPVTVDAGWNELDLDGVYREVAPAIAAEDPDFRERYAALMRMAEDEGHAVHHTWSPCDAAIVGAWIEGRYRTACESWREFVARIQGRRGTLPRCEKGEAVAVFTSAVPIAVWVAAALGLDEGRMMRLAGVMHNTAITTMRMDGGDPELFSFNGVPHLKEAELKTFR